MADHIAQFKLRHLKPGEQVLASGEGWIGEMMGRGSDRQRNGVLMVTQHRVVFYRKGLLGEVLETIPIKTITSVERKSTLGFRTIRMHTSHDKLEFKTLSADAERAVMQALESQREASIAGGPAPTQPDDVVTTLKKLAELRDAGVVTAQEFEAKKAELLARL